MHWVNLRDPAYRLQSVVHVPLDNVFDLEAKDTISRLAGNLHHDLMMPQVATTREDFAHMRSTAHIQVSARALYKQLDREKLRLGDDGPIVRFTRSGWRHITRPTRTAVMRVQSLVLLGAVRRILASADGSSLKGHRPHDKSPAGMGALSAAVSFPFRQTATVKIVVRAKKGRPDEVWFHTIYEPRRKRDPLGVKKVREPLFQ